MGLAPLPSGAFQGLLASLLPTGPAFTRDQESVLQTLLAGFADELAQVDLSASALQLEIDPRSTDSLLSDWEKLLGLPDPCLGDPGSVAARRGLVVARLTQQPSASRDSIKAFAAALGFTIDIVEYQPFRAGFSSAGDSLTNWQAGFRCGASGCGDALENNLGWAFAWSVVATQASSFHFRAGISAAGDPLQVVSNALLQCGVGRLNPAHLLLSFLFQLESA